MRRYLDMLVYGGERRVTPGASPPVWRRLFHIVAGSSIPLAAIFIPETPMVWVLVVLAAQGMVCGSGLAGLIQCSCIGWRRF